MKSFVPFGAAAALILLTACGRGEESANGVTAEEPAVANNAVQNLDTTEDVVLAPDESAMGNGLPVAEDVNHVAPAEPANTQ